MLQRRKLFLHLLGILLMFGLGAAASIYANPYSIHRVVAVPYDQFSMPPDSEGVVNLAGEAIDFRLPEPTLTPATLEATHGASLVAAQQPDAVRAANCVAFVRSRLNAVNASRPRAASADAEYLLQSGKQLHCLCSEHAQLLNEVLQAYRLLSRVVWLEGHVAAEYFDRDLRKWIFLDAHQNVRLHDADGSPLATAEAIANLERGTTVEFAAICEETDQPHALSHRDLDSLWYRNVLLNGECYTLSGSTLRYPSRWSHLARYQSGPQMLVLKTDYDSSHARYIEPFRGHKAVAIGLAFTAVFYALGRVLFGPPRPSVG